MSATSYLGLAAALENLSSCAASAAGYADAVAALHADLADASTDAADYYAVTDAELDATREAMARVDRIIAAIRSDLPKAARESGDKP